MFKRVWVNFCAVETTPTEAKPAGANVTCTRKQKAERERFIPVLYITATKRNQCSPVTCRGADGSVAFTAGIGIKY